MTTLVNIAPVPKFQFSQNGVPLNGGKLFTYAAGTMNKLATYTDQSGGTPNANPIILDANGQGDCWLASGVAYKLILSPSTDTDPPTNPYWTEDNITSSLNVADVQSGVYSNAADTGTANAYAIALSPAPAALTPGMSVGIDAIVASNTGAATLNVNALGALPIQSAGGVALQGGELVATYGAVLRLNHAGTAWVLLQTTGGSLPVIGGTKSEHAINLSQILPISGIVANTATGTSVSTTISFTAPQKGKLMVEATAGTIGPNSPNANISYAPTGATLDGAVGNFTQGSTLSTSSAIFSCAAGPVSIVLTQTAGASGAMNVGATYMFIPTP